MIAENFHSVNSFSLTLNLSVKIAKFVVSFCLLCYNISKLINKELYEKITFFRNYYVANLGSYAGISPD